MIGDTGNQYDRITQILQSQAAPQAQPLGPIENANAFLSSLNGGNFSDIAAKQQQQAYDNARQTQQDTVNNQMNILKVFEAKKAAGDAQAKALDEKIKLFTGDDPEGMSIFLQGLHDDPEDIDPGNSYQVMTKLAKIAKQTGYKSRELKQKESMDSVNNILMKKLNGSPDAKPLNVRNNNPGNMKKDGQFRAFDSPQEGVESMKADLMAKISGKSKAMEANFGKGYQPTLSNVITTWAPPTENDTANYVNFVAQKTGIDPNQVLSPMDIQKIIPAMIEMEGGKDAAQYYQPVQTADSGQIANDATAMDDMDEITQMQVMSALASGDTAGALKAMADAKKLQKENTTATSPEGKLEQDYRKGLISEEAYKAATLESRGKVEGVEKAKKSFDAVLDKISDKLKLLDKEGAIVNQEKDPPGPNAMYNTAVNLGNTALGQYGARLMGTKAQGARDSIVSLKRTLTPLLMKATGMSSQQLNSNVELMTFLDSLGNPQSSLQTNQEIIDTLRQLYGSGSSETGDSQPVKNNDPSTMSDDELLRKIHGG